MVMAKLTEFDIKTMLFLQLSYHQSLEEFLLLILLEIQDNNTNRHL